MARLGSLPLPKVNGGEKGWDQEVASQGRRITGVTPKVTGAFQTKPWRYLKKATGLSTPSGGVGLQRLANGSL
jgi:hypothetical protein